MGTIVSCLKCLAKNICKHPFKILFERQQSSHYHQNNHFSNLPVILEKPEEYSDELNTLGNEDNETGIDDNLKKENLIENKIEMKDLTIEANNTFELYEDLIEIGKTAVETLKDKFQSNFEEFEVIYNESESSNRLKIFMKSYKNSENFQIAIYRSEYYVPCTASKYLDFLNNFQEQKSLTKNFDEYKIVDTFHKNFSIYYICYSKSIITSARDFIYVKHNTRDGNVFYDVTKSIELPEKYPPFENRVRGEIILSGYLLQDVGENECFVKLYSENDFKLKISPNIIKKMSIKEMKSYVHRSIEHVKGES